ncbi:trna 5-methylaminomethyl-2-thiouridylate-methyltransferase [Lasius niger]|uniref:tRNA-5-taurinomethyluridine 2-sulfurtransferase n=1 Tax=Lasius niger TaxID=67767 RepID=A0A0J7KZM4_LASNI|nr:trna 5-methylaminomethyl-2-thiouridylate-methyltransferase [Lasius niger]
MHKKKRIVVGISGGVDSAVSAYILKEQGHEVVGLFMHEFKASRTPNPDIFCNKYIKFSAFLNYARKELNADAIAMGHYAQVKFDEKTQVYQLLKAADPNKDQSYFLAQLNQEQLKYTIFPLAKITKPEVRAIAKKLKLNVANKKDSTGICFIGDRNFKNFLTNYLPAKLGKTIDIKTNKVIGEHHGVYYYTIGQRKGLNLSGFKKPYFVVDKDVKNNILYVANENENH